MRKHKIVTITADGRDKGKSFLLTEMFAEPAERWAYRAFGAMARAGVVIPQAVIESGMMGMSALGLRGFLMADPAEIEPLLAEQFACIRTVPELANLDQATGHPLSFLLRDEDIEEVATRIRLRDEVFELHTGFSVATVLLTAVAMGGTVQNSTTIPTSEELLEPLSPAA